MLLSAVGELLFEFATPAIQHAGHGVTSVVVPFVTLGRVRVQPINTDFVGIDILEPSSRVFHPGDNGVIVIDAAVAPLIGQAIVSVALIAAAMFIFL